jgi:hypothetical protein
MTLRISPKAALVGSALYAIATGILMLVLKGPVVMPTLQWLRGLTVAQLDTYLSLLARGCIGVGAATLFAVILLTRARRASEQRNPDADPE